MFLDGILDLVYDERGGHPKSTQNEVNIAAVADWVKNDHQIALKMKAGSLNIPKTVVQILKENLGKRKLCARFVPHSLTPQQREDHVTACQDIIVMANANKDFFNKIIMGDETQCFAYDSETKRQSSEWVSETSPRLKKQIPKVPHQDHVDNFFRILRYSAQRICTRGKNSKCRIL
jgi:hypothetical protein